MILLHSATEAGEQIFLNEEHIGYMAFRKGKTYIRLTFGKEIQVAEYPEDIIAQIKTRGRK